jgi:sirohydrochlorin cobaltochelatase
MSDPGQAVILFAHGARDARWSQTLGTLARSVAQRMPDAFVATAFLEFQPPTLAETLERAVAAGCRRIAVLPVFWASGGHVASDVPPLLAAFRRAQPQVELTLLPVLSELPGMLEFIADSAARLAGEPPA